MQRYASAVLVLYCCPVSVCGHLSVRSWSSHQNGKTQDQANNSANYPREWWYIWKSNGPTPEDDKCRWSMLKLAIFEQISSYISEMVQNTDMSQWKATIGSHMHSIELSSQYKLMLSVINWRSSSVKLSWPYLRRSMFSQRPWPVYHTKHPPLFTT